MQTLQEVLQENPVKPIRLYNPQEKDWFGETKRYLYRIRDGRRRTELLKRRAELLDSIEDPNEELIRYRDEIHQKLAKAEQDMKRVTVEVMEFIGHLPSVNQQMVMTKRYVDGQTWKETAADMDMAIRTVQQLHGRALPKLKRLLGEKGVNENDHADTEREDGFKELC